MDSLRKWVCPHTQTTFPDIHGYAICLKCCGVIPVTLSKYMFDQAMESMKRL